MKRLWIVPCILFGFACSGDDSELTYYKDVKPIIDDKCNRCHFEGGIGPVALTNYEQVTEVAGLIRTNVESGAMPPWQPAWETG